MRRYLFLRVAMLATTESRRKSSRLHRDSLHVGGGAQKFLAFNRPSISATHAFRLLLILIKNPPLFISFSRTRRYTCSDALPPDHAHVSMCTRTLEFTSEKILSPARAIVLSAQLNTSDGYAGVTSSALPSPRPVAP